MNDLEMAVKFHEAADVLRKHGWLQSDLGLDGGPRCVVGALLEVSSSMSIDNKGELIRVLETRVPPILYNNIFYYNIVGWNNFPGRIKEEVIVLLKDVAHDLELRHQIQNECTKTKQIKEEVYA